jgi:hypothetical protein
MDEGIIVKWKYVYHGCIWVSVVSCLHYRTKWSIIVGPLKGDITGAIDYYNNSSDNYIEVTPQSRQNAAYS